MTERTPIGGSIAPDAPLLDIRNLSISYFGRAGEIPAVIDFSLRLETGEATALVGESGCGKSTVALAIKIILQQIDDVRNELVTDEELETAKQSLIETIPRVFESKPQMLSVFVSDEWTDRPEGYWQNYRDRVQAVTAEDVQRVAREHLDPATMAILVVGNWDEIAAGDLDGRASMADFFEGAVTHLPLRDPLTLEPLE